MKITVFTGNQPRHIGLIHKLAAISDEVYAVQECSTLFTGIVQDSVYNKSPVMQKYFEHVSAAQHRLFGDVTFTPRNARTLSLQSGDVTRLMPELLQEAFQSDYYIVFGASYVRPPLVDRLIEKRAVNIHMGVSPYFRGSSCNFWAIHDGYPELVGATIHLLSRGLDSGDMLFHAFPTPAEYEPFDLGMKAVEVAHTALCMHIAQGTLYAREPVKQDRSLEIRYSRHSDFNDAMAEAYLEKLPDKKQIGNALANNQSKHLLLRPVYA